jgi:hypothetical protein
LRLSTQKRDALGIPHPHVTYDVGDYVRKSAVFSREYLYRIAGLFGATEIEILSMAALSLRAAEAIMRDMLHV